MGQMITEAVLKRWMADLGPRLVTLSAGICRDRHQAEEIVQEAFVKLWQCPPDAGEIAFPSWMRRVVTNLSINALQRTRRPRALPEFTTDRALQTGDAEERAADHKERLDRVRRAMDRLEPAKRAILMLRASEDLSYDEIAEHLGVPIGTVMSRLNRARTALMNEMDRAEMDTEDGSLVFPFRDYKHA